MGHLDDVRIITAPYDDQKPGTAGLRKKTRRYMMKNYLENYIQSIFDTVGSENDTLFLGGDGRYLMLEAIQTIAEMAYANGVKTLWIARDGIVTTPAASAVIRDRSDGVCKGGFILTASHNPGGEDGDFGVKYNLSNGGGALEDFTDRVYDQTRVIECYYRKTLPKVDLSELGIALRKDEFTIEIIDPYIDWFNSIEPTLSFDEIRGLLSNSAFRFVFDGLSGASGPFAKRIFSYLGADEESFRNCTPVPDFRKKHADPNLVYADELVDEMQIFNSRNEKPPTLGGACDADGDRNIVLGAGFFLSPGDSLAGILHYGSSILPLLKGGARGIARSNATSQAVDLVASKKGYKCYCTATGWKYFGELLDEGLISLCGEESFGIGTTHVQEKDGIWGILAWLNIIAPKFKANPNISLKNIIWDMWKIYGRYFYQRHDYEECEFSDGEAVKNILNAAIGNSNFQVAEKYKDLEFKEAYEFNYQNPLTNKTIKNQGWYFIFKNSRVIFRISGTGAAGVTLRVYLEKYSNDEATYCIPESEYLKPLSDWYLDFTQILTSVKKTKPDVIT